MMHIFLTNDDGFRAPGIRMLAKKLSEIARVTVIAPTRGRSSCSSSLTLQEYLRLWHEESWGENISVLSCSGTTADCAKLALEHWLKADMPDLIVSGANHGFNTGSDCLYSGTVAGALEGVFFGIPAIAVSAEDTKTPAECEAACGLALSVIRTYFIDHHFRGILNLNVPKTENEHWHDIKVAKLGLQRYDNALQELRDPSGHLGFWLSGKPVESDSPEEDVYWAYRGYATLTPLTWDQTDAANLAEARRIAEKID